MPHWRHMMSSDKLHADDLVDREHAVTIERVVQGEYPDLEDPKKKLYKPDVWFVGKKKPLGLNSTNARAISRLLGSNRTEDWPGRTITLYPTTTRAFGEEHECIRVKNKLPKEDTGPTRRQRENPPPPITTERSTMPTKDGTHPFSNHPAPPDDASPEVHREWLEREQREKAAGTPPMTAEEAAEILRAEAKK